MARHDHKQPAHNEDFKFTPDVPPIDALREFLDFLPVETAAIAKEYVLGDEVNRPELMKDGRHAVLDVALLFGFNYNKHDPSRPGEDWDKFALQTFYLNSQLHSKHGMDWHPTRDDWIDHIAPKGFPRSLWEVTYDSVFEKAL